MVNAMHEVYRLAIATFPFASSKGDINAKFSIPCFISIPSGNDSRNVTIVEPPLDASMSSIFIPKEAKTHLTVS